MKALLDNRCAPLTYSIGFLALDFRSAVDAAAAWQAPLRAHMETREIDAPLETLLEHLAPLAIPPRKFLLAATASPWVACFDNGLGGGDPQSFVGHLAHHLGCRGLAVTCAPRTRGLAEGAPVVDCKTVSLVVYAPGTGARLDVARSIVVENDDGDWSFRTTGTAQPFEAVEHYTKRAIRDRFTPELLEAYAAALGIRLFDADFYGPRAWLAEIADPLPAGHAPLSLREAQARIGARPLR